jgi:CheY-like chemotaxis protein
MLSTQAAGAHEWEGLRVLIVEDAPVVARALQDFLEDLGMIVVGPASSRAAAERLLAIDSPDLALVDMHLGDTTRGALVTRLLVEKVPVLAVSGSTQLPNEGPKLAALQKPFTGSELLQALRKLLP